MNPVYLINPPPPYPFPLVEPNDDQHLQSFSPSSEASSSLSNSIFSYPAQEQGGSYDREQGQQHQEAIVLQVRPSDHHHEFLQSPSLPTVENGGGVSIKWMSSKMRLMRKMTNSNRTTTDKQVESKHQLFHDHEQPPTSSPLDIDNSTIRVCSDCNTTKTPLWRSGPGGPKSLCNACGIRQRKARRAMAAAATSTSLLGNDTTSMRTKVHKEKRSDNGYVHQYKKRCKLTGSGPRKNSAFHRVFPQDEKEAAILLMDLSCGLVHGF
ncbi:hypothetical protein NE237_030767 [Protea cynaroides]|uniref:GATA-type domain-containing protein n=1 Tax=Protea cynaroides TaxID=273540 RepID=A0A9Q0GWS9_9MAGN|nr:hypothetical protein NE237_030767 [Protea cynaroides]